MVRNTLPPLLLQLVSPAFQLGHYRLEASDLFDGLPFDPRGIVVTQSRVRQLHQGVGSVVINVLTISAICDIALIAFSSSSY